MKTIARLTGLLVAAAALQALAQDAGTPSCDAVTTGTAIYVGGSTALQPFVKAVGPALAAQATPYTLFYSGPGSCVGVNNVLDPVANPLAAGAQFTYYTTTADGGVAANPCTLPASQTRLDLAISDVFVETCSSAARPSTIGDFVGPAQSMVFAVPNGSTQTAITAEEAYIVFGFGGVNQLAPPWTNPSDTTRAIRSASSGTQLILSGAIGVPAAKWKGTNSGSAGGVFNALTASTAAEATIGIIGLDYLDQNDPDGTPRRSKVKMLAFAAKGQTYAYYPDSTHNAYDKRNLRDGHYEGLGYAHLIAPVDTAGVPTQAKVKFVVDLLTGQPVTPAPAFDVSKVIVQTAHLVPQCAMAVQRTAEGGDLKPFKPAASCACYFESLVGTPPASCVSCAASPTACGAGTTCRNGFCEAN